MVCGLSVSALPEILTLHILCPHFLVGRSDTCFAYFRGWLWKPWWSLYRAAEEWENSGYYSVFSKKSILGFFFFWLFRDTPVAYESSQVRGRIAATAANLHHSHSKARLEPRLWPTPQFMATLDGIPPSKDWSLVLVDTSQILDLLSHNGNSHFRLFKGFFIYLLWSHPFMSDGDSIWKHFSLSNMQQNTKLEFFSYSNFFFFL